MPVLFFATLGRIIVGLYFLAGGANKILMPAPAEILATMSNHGVPFADIMYFLAGACEVTAGVCLIVGLNVRLVALLLALFVVLVSFVVHDFWTIPDTRPTDRLIQMVMFLKNMSMMGGLFAFIAFGSGPLAIDNFYDED